MQWRGGQLRAWSHDGAVAVGVTVAFTGDGAEAFCRALPDWYVAVADTRQGPDGQLRSQHDALVRSCGREQVRFAVAPT